MRRQVRWCLTACCRRSLIAAGVAASTTDHELQSIEHTVPDNAEFWSSSGSPSKASDEWLLYKLNGLCKCSTSLRGCLPSTLATSRRQL